MTGRLSVESRLGCIQWPDCGRGAGGARAGGVRLGRRHRGVRWTAGRTGTDLATRDRFGPLRAQTDLRRAPDGGVDPGGARVRPPGGRSRRTRTGQSSGPRRTVPAYRARWHVASVLRLDRPAPGRADCARHAAPARSPARPLAPVRPGHGGRAGRRTTRPLVRPRARRARVGGRVLVGRLVDHATRRPADDVAAAVRGGRAGRPRPADRLPSRPTSGERPRRPRRCAGSRGLGRAGSGRARSGAGAGTVRLVLRRGDHRSRRCAGDGGVVPQRGRPGSHHRAGGLLDAAGVPAELPAGPGPPRAGSANRAAARQPRLADQRRRRRFDVPRDVRSLPPAARGVGRPRDPVAQPPRDLRGARGRRCSRS